MRKKRSQKERFYEFVQELISELKDANQKYSLRDFSPEDPLVVEMQLLFTDISEVDRRLSSGEVIKKEEIVKIRRRAKMFMRALKARFGR